MLKNTTFVTNKQVKRNKSFNYFFRRDKNNPFPKTRANFQKRAKMTIV